MAGEVRLPSISQEVKIGTTALTKAIQLADRLKASLNNALDVGTSTRQFNASMDSVQRELDQTARSARDARQEVQALTRAETEAAAAGDVQRASMGKLSTQYRQTSRDTTNFKRDIDEVTGSFDEANDAGKGWLSSLANLRTELRNSEQQATRNTAALGNVRSRTDDVKRSTDNTSRSLRDADNSGKGFISTIGKILPLAGALSLATRALTLGPLIAGAAQLVPLAGALAGMVGGLGGLGLLLPGVVGSVGALVGVTKALTANNTALTSATKELGNELKPIATTVQHEVNPGLTSLLSTVGSLEPVLNHAAGVIGSGINTALGELRDTLKDPAFGRDIEDLSSSLGSNLGFIGSGVTSLLRSATSVATVSLPIVGQLSARMADMGAHLTDILAKARADGSLQRFLQSAVDDAKQLGSIIGGLAGGIFNLGKLANSTGLTQNLFGALQRGAQGFHNYITSSNDDVVASFHNVSNTVTALGPLISNVGKAAVNVLGQINIVPLIDALSSVVPVLSRGLGGVVETVNGLATVLARLVTGVGPGVSQFFAGLGSAVHAIAVEDGPSLQRFGQAIGNIFGTLGQTLPGLGSHIAQILPPLLDLTSELLNAGVKVIPPLVSGIGHLISALQPLMPLLRTGADVVSTMVGALGHMPSPISTVVAGLGTYYVASRRFKSGSDDISNAAKKVGTDTEEAGNKTTGFGNKVKGMWSSVVDSYTAGAMNAGRQYQVLGTMGDGLITSTGGVTNVLRDAASKGFGAVKSAGSSLINAMGGPWMIGIAAFTAAIGAYSDSMAQQAKREKEATAAGNDLIAVYQKSGSAFTAASEKARQHAIDTLGLGEAAKNAGIDTDTLNAALEGSAGAQKKVSDATGTLKDRWNAFWDKDTSFGDIISGNFMTKDKNTFDKVADSIGSLNSRAALFSRTTGPASQALKSYETALEGIYGPANGLIFPLDNAGKALQKFADAGTSVQKQDAAITGIFNSLKDPAAALNDVLAKTTTVTTDMGTAFSNLNKGAIDKTTKSIDLTTAAGAQLYQSLENQSGAWQTLINDTYNDTKAKSGNAAAADAAAKKSGELRDAFIKSAEGAGISTEQAGKLASQLGLLPKNIAIEFLAHTNEAIAEADLLRGHVIGITKNPYDIITNIKDQATLDELANLGYTVKHLPDGSVEIIANTDAAKRAIDALYNYSQQPINIGVSLRTGRMAQAEGGILVKKYDQGGIEQPNMPANVATIVPPNTWRVIGDRPWGDEAYIPINNSQRSLAILRETVDRMGYALADKAVMFADGAIAAVSTANLAAFRPVVAGTAPVISPNINLGDNQLSVSVQIGDTELRSIIRSEVHSAVQEAKSASTRAVLTGTKPST